MVELYREYLKRWSRLLKYDSKFFWSTSIWICTPTLTTFPHLCCACGTQKCSIMLALCSNGCSFYYAGFCQGLVGGSLVIRLSKSVSGREEVESLESAVYACANFTQGLSKPLCPCILCLQNVITRDVIINNCAKSAIQ